MKWRKWFEKWGMTSLKIKSPFLEADLRWKDADKAAAWEMYIELLTRITTQPLDTEHGDEKTALESVYSLFPITRQVLKNNTKHCVEFAKLAIVILNQIVRPFTAKWHRLSLQGAFGDPKEREQFRKELDSLQVTLRKYAKMLADMAGVEDLTSLEDE